MWIVKISVFLLRVLAENDKRFLIGFQALRSSYEVQLNRWRSASFYPFTQGSAAI